MREQRLIDLQQSFLVIHKEIQYVFLVPICEVSHLHSVLSQLCKSQQTLLEFLGFFTSLVELLELLPVIYFVLQAAFHDLFPNFFNALNEK